MKSLPLLLMVLALAAMIGTPMALFSSVHFDLVGPDPVASGAEYNIIFTRADVVNETVYVQLYSPASNVTMLEGFTLCAFCVKTVPLAAGNYSWSTGGDRQDFTVPYNKTVQVWVNGGFPPAMPLGSWGLSYGDLVVAMFLYIVALVGALVAILLGFAYAVGKVSQPKTPPGKL